ncbi:hypothetical protein AMTR_s00042p00126970 [Amborella trichopoda]|uniref:Uncharacterized protein n=1 Tax=Amborella trichopoda TaxID=13333 RepID=W1P158_AMBTC|nr:hypothetical protein AMTR_s00042p00126970 [Amborella trichopoda]
MDKKTEILDKNDHTLLPVKKVVSDNYSRFEFSEGLYSSVHSVTVYKFEDLQKATNDFSSNYRVILEKDEEREKDVLLSTVMVPLLEREDVREKLRSQMDPSLGEDYPLDLALTMTQQAKTCLLQDLGSRLDISDVLLSLSRILSSSLDWVSSHITHFGSGVYVR